MGWTEIVGPFIVAIVVVFVFSGVGSSFNFFPSPSVRGSAA